MRSLFVLFAVIGVFSLTADAAETRKGFVFGPVFTQFGQRAETQLPHWKFENNAIFKVAFDVGSGAEGGKLNQKFDSLARFINMHVAAGVNPENIELALVVHGRASIDILQNAYYKRVHNLENPNLALLSALMSNNVKVILCGQTATAYEIQPSQLIEGAEVWLSAMTAHAVLQQQGYTINPF